MGAEMTMEQIQHFCLMPSQWNKDEHLMKANKCIHSHLSYCGAYDMTSRAALMVNEKVCTPIMDTSLALPIEVDIVTSQWQTINPNENLGWKLKNVFLRRIAVEEVFAEHAPVVVQHKMERMWRIVQFWP